VVDQVGGVGVQRLIVVAGEVVVFPGRLNTQLFPGAAAGQTGTVE